MTGQLDVQLQTYEEPTRSESNYYTQVLDEVKIDESMNSTLSLDSIPHQKENNKQKFKRYLTKVRRATFGNRRLKAYLLTIAKVCGQLSSNFEPQ